MKFICQILYSENFEHFNNCFKKEKNKDKYTLFFQND